MVLSSFDQIGKRCDVAFVKSAAIYPLSAALALPPIAIQGARAAEAARGAWASRGRDG